MSVYDVAVDESHDQGNQYTSLFQHMNILSLLTLVSLQSKLLLFFSS